MPLSAPEIVTGELYLIAIPEFEGELRVGLGRAEAVDGTEAEAGGRRVSWLSRRGWSNDPTCL
eukprot:3198746-Pleurochrysis_carterae.AAC.1